MADTLAEFFLNRNCQRIGFACAGVTISAGGSRPARRHTFFASAKKSMQKMAFSCGGHFLRMDLWLLLAALVGT
jgi:hypothetical protein